LGFCFLACLLAGCDGESDEDDGDAQCSASVCGGDVVGTWNVESYCLTLAQPPAPDELPECQNVLRSVSVDAEGPITFTADMVTSNLTTTTALVLVLTDACAQALGGGNVTSTMCDSLEAQYTSNPEYSSASCRFAPGSCSCSIVTVPSTTSETNPYSISGNQILIPSAETTDYCVDGDRLSLSATGTDSSYSIVARRAP
jgi:hypothetical protein